MYQFCRTALKKNQISKSHVRGILRQFCLASQGGYFAQEMSEILNWQNSEIRLKTETFHLINGSQENRKAATHFRFLIHGCVSSPLCTFSQKPQQSSRPELPARIPQPGFPSKICFTLKMATAGPIQISAWPSLEKANWVTGASF